MRHDILCPKCNKTYPVTLPQKPGDTYGPTEMVRCPHCHQTLVIGVSHDGSTVRVTDAGLILGDDHGTLRAD